MRANKLARPSVLVVDDDEDIRTTIRDVLADPGFTVACAANGREALELLINGQSKPALILLDLTMPEMDGWTFRQEQQKVPRLAQIPVVLFSGHHDAARAAQSLNAVALMTKPLRLEGLVTLVEQLALRSKPN
jgi:CheY-like chemotaxis protein